MNKNSMSYSTGLEAYQLCESEGKAKHLSIVFI